MPQLIQNLACLELTCGVNERRIPFSKDTLRGKRIKSLFLFASSEEVTSLNPYRNEEISYIYDLNSASLFLNLVDIHGNPIIENFSFDSFVALPDSVLVYDLNINRVLDLDQCFISVKADVLPTPLKLLLFVSYETETPGIITDKINGILQIKIPITELYQDIKLIDFISNKLKGKLIRKITAVGSNPYYLDLVCTNGRRIENIPMSILATEGANEFYFDNLKIDYEHSYVRVREIIYEGSSYLIFTY